MLRSALTCSLALIVVSPFGAPERVALAAPGPQPAAAPAEPPATEAELAQARELGASGIELYETGAYPEASQQLEHAYRFVKVPTTGLWSARALDKVGQLLAAAERYREVLAMPVQAGEPPVFAEARRSAEHELQELEARTPRLVIRIAGAEPAAVSVSIDDLVVAPERIGTELRVDPGDRRIVGVMGDRIERVTLAIPERATGSAILDFTPAKAPTVASDATAQPGPAVASGDGARPWAYLALGVGAAAVVGGVVTTIVASGQESELEANCPEQQCDPPFHGDVDALNTTLTISFASYVVGALGLGVGTYLLLAPEDPLAKDAPTSSVSVWLGPTSAGLSGRF